MRPMAGPSRKSSGRQAATRVTAALPTPGSEDAEAGIRALSLEPSRSNGKFETINVDSSNFEDYHESSEPLANIGAGVQELVTVIDRLEGLGLARLDIPLPKVCVLGDQSTGKSSLIEGISGIRVPRASGTCTRCPLFIKLSSSEGGRDNWQAKIILRRTHDFRRAPKPSRTAKFFLWDEKAIVNEIAFDTVDNPDDLPEAINRAHFATLNPGYDPMALRRGQPPLPVLQANQADFSPNVVCIHISAPGLPNLSFYDLPGIIALTEETSKDYQVKFVENLVMDYVTDPEALILLTCTMETDLATSMSSRIARNKKATGRCIGVLTKPDRRPNAGKAEDLAHIKALLGGSSFQLGHGYFVTKQPSTQELHLSHGEARELERKFFSKEPWAVSLAAYSDRFGTANLQEFLSRKLAQMTLRALPNIRDQIETHLRDVQDKLAQIPKPPTDNPQYEVQRVIREFCAAVKKYIEGDIQHNTWTEEWKAVRKTLATRFNRLKPNLDAGGASDAGLFTKHKRQKSNGSALNTADVIMLSSDDDKSQDSVLESPTKKRKLDSVDRAPSTPKKPSGSFDRKPVLNGPLPTAVKLNLDQLRDKINSMSVSKLPNEVNPMVTEHLIRETMAHWGEQIQAFWQDFEKALKAHIRAIFKKSFNRWETTALYRDGWAMVDQLLSMQIAEQRDTMSAESLNDELEGPYVFNEFAMDAYKKSFEVAYRKARSTSRMKTYFREMEEETGKEFADSEMEAIVAKDSKLSALLKNSEPYQREMHVMVTIRSYYQLASTRLHDAICMRIHSKLFKILRDDLEGEMSSTFGIFEPNGRDICMSLLAEDAAREEERKLLESRMGSLVEGRRLLEDLRAKYDTDQVQQINLDGPSDEMEI